MFVCGAVSTVCLLLGIAFTVAIVRQHGPELTTYSITVLVLLWSAVTGIAGLLGGLATVAELVRMNFDELVSQREIAIATSELNSTGTMRKGPVETLVAECGTGTALQ